MLAINKNDEIEVHIWISGEERVLDRAFFSTNLEGYRDCCRCGKKHLNRIERIDCEFWEDDTESWCLDCWSKGYLATRNL